MEHGTTVMDRQTIEQWGVAIGQYDILEEEEALIWYIKAL